MTDVAGPRTKSLRPEPMLMDEYVKMAHGSGGKAMHDLVQAVFLREFANPLLEPLEDQAVFRPEGMARNRIAFTTDSFVVSPLFFPGGDIGRLAVHGTLNDLAVSGADPLCLSAGFILEEGFPIDSLRRVVASMAAACAEAGVAVVTGDTKVVNRGKADRLYINTAGIGVIRRDVTISAAQARPGDRVIVSGSVGDHGIALMIARHDVDIDADIESDTANLHPLVQTMLEAGEVHCLRDATRGGLATTLNEIARDSGVAVFMEEAAVPVLPSVRAACEILGIDPAHVANEGKLVAIVERDSAEGILAAMQAHPLGRDAAIIGEVAAEPAGRVLLHTPFGGTRIIDMLVGDPLPRIC